jgi:thiol-disulfide isomerase/thioredoxin
MTMRTTVLLIALAGLPAAAAAPDPFSLKVRTLDGAPKALGDYRGQVILLNFWSTTCPPCRTETPWFVEFQKAYKDR